MGKAAEGKRSAEAVTQKRRAVFHGLEPIGVTITLLILALSFLTLATSSYAARGWVFSKAFGEGTQSVAVNEATGQVYVASTGRVRIYSSEGVLEGEFNGSGEAPTALVAATDLAVDNACIRHAPVLTESTTPKCHSWDPSAEDVYVSDIYNKVVDKFSPTGRYLGQIGAIPQFVSKPGVEGWELVGARPMYQGPAGVAVDSEGEVWIAFEPEPPAPRDVANYSRAEPNVFSAVRTLTSAGKVGNNPAGLAVDSQDNLYLESESSQGERIGKWNVAGGVPIISPLDDEASTGVAVESPSEEVYIDNVTTVGRFTSSGSETERIGAGYLTDGRGLAINSSAHLLYVVDSSDNHVDLFTPEPASVPAVEQSAVSHVSASGATITGHVTPRSEGNEADTSWQFRYGTAPCDMTPSPCTGLAPNQARDIATGFSTSTVSTQLQALAPSTTYFFQLVASNAHGTTEGEVESFTTQPAALESPLLDGRAWELVSPAIKYGATFEPISETGSTIMAAESGQALTYSARGSTEARPRGEVSPGKVQILSRRGASGGWHSRDLVTPQTVLGGENPEYKAFSLDLTNAIVEPAGFTSLLSCGDDTASERTPYLWEENGLTSTGDCFMPLVNGTPGFADVMAGTQFGGPEGEETHPDVRFVAATVDLGHVVLDSSVPLLENATGGGLYEWSKSKPIGEQLELVSLIASGPAVCYRLGYEGEPALGVVRNAISAEGTRIVWEGAAQASECAHDHLYLTEAGGTAITHQIDAVTTGTGAGEVRPVFQTAAADGSVFFFTDAQQLTAASTAVQGEPDLYAYDATSQELVDVTRPVNAGEHVDVRGVPGASDDGADVYLVAGGVLTETPNASGEQATAGQNNLYLLRDEGGMWRPTFIARLSAGDSNDWTLELKHLTSRVSPNGRFYAFMSERSLTGYDNNDASGQQDEEVYEYDAQGGRVSCVSCNPTGERPTGVELLGEGKLGFHGYSQVDLPRNWSNRWVAGLVPGWTSVSVAKATYQSRYLDNEGRLFFDSADALAPNDTNGTWDVYEYELPGLGGCSRASAQFSTRDNGCLGLVSSGASSEESAFLDASGKGAGRTEGEDVFFLTAAKLTSQDKDTALDVYDAHVCSAAAPCVPQTQASVAPCEAAIGCKKASVQARPSVGLPASLTFDGHGNLAVPAKSANKTSSAHRDKAKKKHAHRRGGRKGKHAHRHRRRSSSHCGKHAATSCASRRHR